MLFLCLQTLPMVSGLITYTLRKLPCARLGIIVTVLLSLEACKTEEETKPWSPPGHFPTMVYQNANNEPNAERIALGKALFYDPLLSSSGTISCGSCHAQVHGFSDHNTPLSFGVHNRLGSRNTPPLVNLAWSPNFMWDGGINHLDVMPIAPITNPVEMDISLAEALEKIRSQSRYKNMVSLAFGDTAWSEKRLLYALSQFMLTLQSSNSRYDQFYKGQTSALNDIEKTGYRLFQNHCSSCHVEPLTTGYTYERNGMVCTDDMGRMKITNSLQDQYKFKVPTLRNIAVTYPYMHDGSIKSLFEVVAFYAEGGNSNSDPRIQNISMSQTEQDQILAFLQSLTDYSFLSNPALSE
jgi:cytochrome c peroxidase